MLRDDDSVVLMTQINDEGEIIVVTDEGKFKKVIASQIEKSKRYRKGSIIVSMRDGASVLCAAYVTAPYMLAIVDKSNNVSEISSETLPIMLQSVKARKLPKYAENSIESVIPMPYKKDE
jgi:DNA gyrase/topoisomerase IV subunit A